jgi:SAM-dependent methyltransferase
MEEKTESGYSPEVANLYVQQEEGSDVHQKVFRPNVIDAWQLSYNPTMKLVDLGCGGGNYTRAMQKITGGQAVGYDSSPTMIQIAREHEAKTPQHIQYFIYDITHDPLKEPGIAAHAPYDFAYCGWVFSSSPDLATLAAMANSASKLLKPGGVLVAIVDNPFLPPSKYKLLERYRTFLSAEGSGDEVTDGRPLHIKFVSDPMLPALEVTDYLWTTGTFEKVFKAAGFSQFAFLPGPIRIDAENEYEAQYFDVYAKNPDFTLFRARK